MLYLFLATALHASPTVASTRVHGSIEASLVKAVGADGPALAAQVARLIRWRGDVVSNVHPGDELRVAFEQQEGPALVALSYHGTEIQLDAIRFADQDGVSRYFDGEGTLVEPRLRDAPVPSYVQITEVVQKGRGKRRHQGLDLKAPEGTPIRLPFAGRVSRVNWLRHVNGNCVEIRYQNGNYARFLHLAEVDPKVATGVRMSAGEKLGTVGSTGRSGAPHLHYDLRNPSGRILDPLTVHGTDVVHVSASFRDAFARQWARYQNALKANADQPALRQ